jgi:excisionase family DNA binding protein
LKRKRIVKTAELTIETEESVVLRATKGRQTSFMWCPGCRRQVEMVTPEQAARIADVSTRTIYRWVEAGTLHFIESSGEMFLCVSALCRRASG